MRGKTRKLWVNQGTYYKDKMRETARWEEYCTQTTVAIGKRGKPKKT